ncbi:MAG TPA: ADOP family duplicated permease [Vicinamibacterales bacterium]|nr:ADOP family duplicated permease [Vicinamibacterales bacterium]
MNDSRHDRPEAVPRLARWLAGLRIPAGEREFAMGDLEEEFKSVVLALGVIPARRWYWRQALRSCFYATPPTPKPASNPPLPPGETVREIIREGRLAVRQLWARPLISMTAIVTFALGIGANVAMFTVAWPMLMAPLPFPDEGRLTVLSLTYERKSKQFRNPMSRGDYLDFRNASSFASMSAFNQFKQEMNLTGRGETDQVRVGFVGAEWFSVLGVKPVLGRLFQPSDNGSSSSVIVLSDSLWRQRFGGDRMIVGQQIRLDGRAYEVIGVAPSSAGLGTVEAAAWTVQPIDPGNRMRGAYFLGAVARLRPGTTLEAANQELAAIMARAAVEFPQTNKQWSGARAELFRDVTTETSRSSLELLLISAGLVLLVSVINLTGLQLSRYVDRERERAVRRALGATRWQLARQVIVENVTMAAVGGACGLGVAIATLQVLESIAPSFGWRHLVPASRPLMTAFAAAVTLAAGLLAGAVPAWRVSKTNDTSVLQARAATAGRHSHRWRTLVVAGQVAATAVLLIVAAMVARSQLAVLSINPGFDFRNGLAADLNPPAGKYESMADITRFFNAVIERVEALPGVERACVINEVPLDGTAIGMTYVPEGTTNQVHAVPSTITPGCVPVLRLSLLRGRWFTNNEPQPSIVISASMAKALWPDGRDPIGLRVHFGVPTAPLLTVVGVTGDIRGGSLESSYGQQVWAPQSLGNFPPTRLLVRAAGPGGINAEPVRAAVRTVDPDIALAHVRTMDDIVGRATSARRFALFLLAGFAVVAVILSAVGIYSVLANVVGQRTREIGIRLALGAHSGQVVRLVVTQLSLAVGVGIVAGLWSARALTRFVASLLYQVKPADPRFYVAVAIVVTVIAALAAWAPTRRALRIDPKAAMSVE